MSVADILQQMAANAGRAQLQKGQIYGNLIAGASQIPGQILADREAQRVQQFQLARQQQQDAIARDANARANSDQGLQDAAAQEAQRQKAVAREVIKAYTGGTPNDPTTNSLEAGIAKARELGAEDQIAGLRKMHADEMAAAHPKPYQTDPTHDTRDALTNEIITPGVEKPPAMGTPGYEIYARQQALLHPPAVAPAPVLGPSAAPADHAGDPSWTRADGTPKGNGFLGPLKRPDGTVSSEISVGVTIDGKETEIPTLVPTLTSVEKNWLLTHDISDPSKLPQPIVDKAIAFAKTRIAAGQSPFAGPDDAPGAAPAAALTPNQAYLKAAEEQRAATAKETHSPAYKEWQDYTASGGKLDFSAYQTMDANRHRSVTINNAATDDKTLDEAARNLLANPRDLTSIKNITTLRGDQRLKLFNRLKQLDPSFNVGNIDRQIKFLDSYENPAGKPAMNRQSMNNILMHSADLSDVNEEYRRSKVRLVNLPLNQIQKQYSADYERYATTVAVLKDEISLYFAGGYAPTKEQGATWSKILNDETTPNQTEAFAKQIIHVGLRRASTHNSDFRSVMGYDDPNLITPDAVKAAGHLGMAEAVKPFGSGGTLGGRSTPGATPAAGPAPKRIRYDMNGRVIGG